MESEVMTECGCKVGVTDGGGYWPRKLDTSDCKYPKLIEELEKWRKELQLEDNNSPQETERVKMLYTLEDRIDKILEQT